VTTDDGAVDAKLNDELVRLCAAAVWVDTLTLRRYFGHDFREFPPPLSSKIRELERNEKKIMIIRISRLKVQ
jgi:hypothetical protein